jgi:hypothetical protein
LLGVRPSWEEPRAYEWLQLKEKRPTSVVEAESKEMETG